jgi:hypothetical protein
MICLLYLRDFEMRVASLLMLVGCFLASGAVNDAKASISVNWGGPNNVVDADYLFAGFVANQLTSITGPGYSHNHGNTSVVFTIGLRVDGNWVTIDSWSQNSADHLLSERTLGGPISFSGGTVDGIRLTSNPDVNQAYHNMNTNPPTVFTFDSVQSGSVVPEPSSIGIWSIFGLAISGVVVWRRKKILATG